MENQETSGWCWAYSSLKCLETYFKQNKNLDYNLAEYHLAYMRLKEFGGWNEDLASIIDSTEYANSAYKKGGNFDEFMKYVGVYSKDFSIKGPILGEDNENKKYTLTDENKTSFLSKKPVIKVNKTVQFANISKQYLADGTVSYKNGKTDVTSTQVKNFRNEVKKQIKNNSAVFAIIDMDSNDLNSNNYSLYTNESDIENCHAVTIIGWDDGYSATNFNNGKRPTNDGAWIALNSWGDSFGNNGIFYISYDDAIVEKFMCGIVEAKEYTNSPSAEVTYDKSKAGQVKVTISSNERLEKPDDTWTLTNDEYYLTTYSKVRTTSSKLEKTFYSNVENQTISLQDNSGAKATVTINIDSLENFKQGDINKSSSINVTDLLLLKRHIIAGNKTSWILNEEQLKLADINGDGKVNVTDLLLLKRLLIK